MDHVGAASEKSKTKGMLKVQEQEVALPDYC